MTRVQLGANAFVYPMPVTLVGANVGGKANFLAVAWINRVNFKPPIVAMGLGKGHHTNGGILENRTFSVNIPGADLVEKTDYCGLVSGTKVDKAALFDVFYGKLETAPMIGECPLAFECRLVDTVDLGADILFLGEIIESYADEQYLTDGKPDVVKMKPFVLTMPDNGYWLLGNHLAKAWQAGKHLKK